MRVLDWFEDVVMVACMAIITVLITTQVVLRYVFNDSVTWAEEITRFLVIWMSFIGAAMGVRLSAHIAVDLLPSMLPEGKQRYLTATVCLGGLIFAGCIFWYGGRLFLHTLNTGQLSSAMRVPMYCVYFIFPLAGALLSVRFIQRFAESVGAKPSDDGAPETKTTLPGG